jgi:hypothetical protein
MKYPMLNERNRQRQVERIAMDIVAREKPNQLLLTKTNIVGETFL